MTVWKLGYGAVCMAQERLFLTAAMTESSVRFDLTRKRDLELWASLNNVPHIEDDSNKDTRYTRNYIRHTMMHNVLKVNPGIHKTIAKKVKSDVTTKINTVTVNSHHDFKLAL